MQSNPEKLPDYKQNRFPEGKIPTTVSFKQQLQTESKVEL